MDSQACQTSGKRWDELHCWNRIKLESYYKTSAFCLITETLTLIISRKPSFLLWINVDYQPDIKSPTHFTVKKKTKIPVLKHTIKCMSCCKPIFPKKHIIGEYDSTWLDLVHFESEPLVMFAISLHAHRNMIQFWLGRQTLWAHADGRHKTANVTETVTRTQGP